MLTRTEYYNLWGIYFDPLVIANQDLHGIPCPPYDQYLLREHMLEDYLDIFRGYDSRGNLAIRPVPLIMGFPHPFFNNGVPVEYEGVQRSNKLTQIKYVLIAEAAPEHVPGTPGTFFYNTLHLGDTGYFSATLEAFQINQNIKDQSAKARALLRLALEGVILLDLFPFALRYKPLRKPLNNEGVTSAFWGGVGGVSPATIWNRFNRLAGEILVNEKCTACLIAPPQISHFLAHEINHAGLQIPAGLSILPGMNEFGPLGGPLAIGTPVRSPSHRPYFFDWPAGSHLNGTTLNGVLTMAPKYRCCAYGTAMTVPHYVFIQNALG